MQVIHISRPISLPAHAPIFGGLNCFIEELSACQRSMGFDIVSLKEISSVDKKRTVVHFHDWYGGEVIHDLYASGFRACIFTSHLPLRRGFTYRDSGTSWNDRLLWEAELLAACKAIVAPSEYVADFLASEYGIFRKKIDIVRHGVNISRFKPSVTSNTPDRSNTVLAVGRLTEQKGFDLLIRAWDTVKHIYPHLKLRIAGEGHCRQSLADLIQRLGCTNDISLLGELPQDQLCDEYASADLFVLPSLFEPFGLVGLEAMASGCPVLSTFPSGASEYLTSTELTPSFSPQQLGVAIVERLNLVYADATIRASVQARAAEFDWSKAARSYSLLYQEVIA